jgi:ribosomal protein S18 acetylase RimI-like enzyme
MTIRRATYQDASAVAELILLAIKDIGYKLTGEQTESDVLEQLQRFYGKEANRFGKDLILIKEVGQNIAGMILCYHGSEADRLNEPIIEHLTQFKGIEDVQIDQEADKDEYYIDALAVSPDYQSLGYAKQLLAAAEQQALQFHYHKIALNVDQTNESALKLYQQIGYIADKVITIDNRPYWHMSKMLFN